MGRQYRLLVSLTLAMLTTSGLAAYADENVSALTLNTKLRVKDLTLSPDKTIAIFSVDDQFPTVQTPEGPLSASTVEQAQLWLKDTQSGEEKMLTASTIPAKIAAGTVRVGDVLSEYVYWDPAVSPDNKYLLVTELQIPMKVDQIRLSLGERVLDTSYETKDLRSKLMLIDLESSQKSYLALPFPSKSFIMNTNTVFSTSKTGFVSVNVRISKPYFGRPADFDSRYVMKLNLAAKPSLSLFKTTIGSGNGAQVPWAISPNGRFTTTWILSGRGVVFQTQSKRVRYFSFGEYRTPTIRGITDDGGFVLIRDNRKMTLFDITQGSKTTEVADGARLTQNIYTHWKYNWDLSTSTLAVNITLRQLVP